MQKILFVLLLFCIVSFKMVNAQIKGVKLGFALSQTIGVDLPKYVYNTYNPYVEIYYNHRFTKGIYWHQGLSYIRLGNKMTDEIPVEIIETYKITERFHYLQFPLALKFGNEAVRLRYYIYLGADPSVMFYFYRQTEAWAGTIPVNADRYYPFDVRRFDLRPMIGGGFYYKKIITEFKFATGFFNIYTNHSAPGARNRVFTIMLGYQISNSKGKRW